MSPEVARSVRQLEGTAKVTGAIDYIGNLVMPGMLHGKIVRSTRPHALIDKIDTSLAQDCDGVRRVLTGADILRVLPNPYSGPAFHDQPALAVERVRFVGEPVALVLADSAAAAARAAEQVVVDYSDLPFVLDEVLACSDSAPLVHERLRPGDTFTDLRHLRDVSKTNIALDATVRHGQAPAELPPGCREFSHEYKTQAIMHTPLESHVAVADPSEPGRLQIFSTTQSPSFVRLEVARMLGWPEQRVRIRSSFLGGGFGAKLYVKLEPLVAAAALLVGKPVRIALTMEEQFFTICRHATTTRITSTIDADNRIISRRVNVWWNGGAYADIGPRVTQKSGFVAGGAYRIPHVEIDSRAVYTHRTPAGAMRGFGIPQVIFAVESHMDEIARDLGIDPIQFRLDNLIQPGDEHASGTVLSDVEVEQVFRAVLEKMPPGEPGELADDAALGGAGRSSAGPRSIRRGRGYAVALKAVVTPSTSVAEVVMAADGSVSVHQNTVDVGQGSSTATAQIAAQVLSVPAESITMLRPDTDLNPYDMGTLGSRSLFHMGNAVKIAAEEVRDQLLQLAATVCPDSHDHVLADGRICGTAYRDLFSAHFGAQAGTLVGRGAFTPAYDKPDPTTGQSTAITAFWMAGAAAAEVSVDMDTGKVRVDRLVVSGDVGQAVNPHNVRRQLSGGAVMQLGMTLSEQMVWEDGQLTNPGLAFYKVPGILDVPTDLEVAIVESVHPGGPFGAKGVGETGTFAVSPAVANAVANAVGVRVRELPLTPERVLEAIRAGASE